MLRDRSNIQFGKRRLRELRDKKRPSVDDTIKNSRTTVLINIAIEIFSGILFMIGLVYAIRFLNLRRPFIGDTHYLVMFWGFLVIGVGWFVWLLMRMRRKVNRLFELRAMKRQREAEAAETSETPADFPR